MLGRNKLYTIEQLYASAWQQAIEDTAELVNSLNKSSNIYGADDWIVLECYAIVNNLKFDQDGYLVE